jgi:hypothetical protein
MNEAYHISKWWTLGLCLAAVTLSSIACTEPSIPEAKLAQLERQARTRGLIIGFEGLQPFSGHRADDLTKQVAKELHLVQVATSGNPSVYLPLVTSAHDNGQPIYIVGYSLGGDEANNLAEICKKAGIPVDILFLLDPGAMGVFAGKIPDNVHKVVVYQSGTYDNSSWEKPSGEFLEDPERTQVEFHDLSKLNHMNLPSHLAGKIKDQIKSGPGGRSVK